MQNDLRQNPRFLSSDGVPARMLVDGREWQGVLHNFSSTGFAIVLTEDIGEVGQTRLEVVFAAPTGELKFSAVVSNKTAEAGKTRLGCRITDMHGLGEAYFSFLTQMMFSQGMLKSMATKPVKCRT